MSKETDSTKRILLTGGTGYVGGRLLPRLVDSGFKVRCAARNPESLSGKHNAKVEIVRADLFDLESLEIALNDVEIAYYLAHSLGSNVDFEEKERCCARNFAAAAKKIGVKRIIYLGGLGTGENLSPHLKTRQEVGQILCESGAQVIEFRASIIIGSGSLSFEMVRALVDRLPIMITPRWVRAKAQPIAIEDVLDYLTAAIELQTESNEIFEIGGPDVVTYMDIMRAYERHQGVHRLMIPVPFLTPRLSSLWLGLVTPLYARVGRKLVDSIRHDTLVTNSRALTAFAIEPRGLEAAIDRALANEDREFAATRWSDALSAAGEVPSLGGVIFGSRIIDSRVLEVKCKPECAFKPIREIGGINGWYYAEWAWNLRGFIDLLVGGVGTRRGRTSQESLTVGDSLDFWRVEAIEENKLLLLRAEMKLPGRAWLQFEVDDGEDGSSTIRQTALFDPVGVLGRMYWYLLYPIHTLIFDGMLREIKKRAVNSG